MDKQRRYQAEWLKRRRSGWILKHGPCVKCGSWEELQIDHIDPSTKNPKLVESSGNAMWSWSEKRRNEELSKCQILCKKCHLEKTTLERPKTDHGRGQMYQKYKCRCDLCREWKRLSDAKYRKRSLTSPSPAATLPPVNA